MAKENQEIKLTLGDLDFITGYVRKLEERIRNLEDYLTRKAISGINNIESIGAKVDQLSVVDSYTARNGYGNFEDLFTKKWKELEE